MSTPDTPTPDLTTTTPNGTSTPTTTPAPNSSPAGAPARVPLHSWFASEIQSMMHGLGDYRKPLLQSATLIEEIVHGQMMTLLYEATEAATLRGVRYIGIEELLFLLRRDKVKLHRLLRYLDLKDMKCSAVRGSVEDDESDTDKAPVLKRRKKACHDFLSAIDQTGELLGLFDDDSVDEVKHQRMLRADASSLSMDNQQYMEFCESRQASFSNKHKIHKFRDWLMMGMTFDLKPNQLALEVLSYLAYECIAQIVDLSLIVKQDRRARYDDPITQNIAHVCMNYGEISGSAGQGVSDAVPTSPNVTPPSTPVPSVGSQLSLTSNSQSASGNNSQNSTNNNAALSSAKSKVKKRKKSGPVLTLETSYSYTILPSDIREAMRRYGHSIGPFSGLSKSSTLMPQTGTLLCC